MQELFLGAGGRSGSAKVGKVCLLAIVPLFLSYKLSKMSLIYTQLPFLIISKLSIILTSQARWKKKKQKHQC